MKLLPASDTSRVSIALVLGVCAGITAGRTHSPTGNAIVDALTPVGTLWVNGIRMTVVPLVVALVIRAIAGTGQAATAGRLGTRSAAFGLGGMVVLALTMAAVAPILFRRVQLDPQGVAALRTAGVQAPATTTLPTMADWLTSFVPTNPIRAAADSAMLPLLVFVVAFACALRVIDPSARAVVVKASDAIAEAMLQLVRWVLALAPIGVLALAATLGAKVGLGVAGALGFYVIAICALFLISTLAMYPVAVMAGGVSLRDFAAGVAPAQAVAFSSRSSLASLPALIDGSARVGVSAETSGFVLPLAVAMFKFTQPIAWLTGSAFVAQLYGVPFAAPQIAAIGAGSVILSLAAPGIPSGGLFMMAPIYMTVGMPVEGIGVLIALDAIPDMFKTVANVSADMVLATTVGRASQPV